MACLGLLLAFAASIRFSAAAPVLNDSAPVLMTHERMGDDIIPSIGERKKTYHHANGGPRKLWPNGVMIYHLDPDNRMNDQQKRDVLATFDEISRKTSGCIKFKARTNEKAGYTTITLHDKSCDSNVGYPGTLIHNINLEKTWCIGSKVTIMHEALHALGFFHEEDRPDRDNYVSNNDPNLKPPQSWAELSTQCLPYDYLSVLHYDGYTAKDPAVTCVGASCSNSLSEIDVVRLRRRYGCAWSPPWCKEGMDMSGYGGLKAAGGGRVRPETYLEKGLKVETSDRYNYKFVRTKCGTSATFRVTAANDAHVALSKDSEDTLKNTYEIVIGGWGNAQSCIRVVAQGKCVASYISKGLLSPAAPVQFWVSWADGAIRVGKGNVVGTNTFMQYKHTAPYTVNFLGVSTGFGSTGKWEFD